MKSKKPAKLNEKQDMSRDEKFDLWLSKINEFYDFRYSYYLLFGKVMGYGQELGLINKGEEESESNYYFYKKWSESPYKITIVDILRIWVLLIKHDIIKDSIDFDLLYKNKERFGNWESALLITKAISKNETSVIK